VCRFGTYDERPAEDYDGQGPVTVADCLTHDYAAAGVVNIYTYPSLFKMHNHLAWLQTTDTAIEFGGITYYAFGESDAAVWAFFIAGPGGDARLAPLRQFGLDVLPGQTL
jgi:hypothetical protein